MIRWLILLILVSGWLGANACKPKESKDSSYLENVVIKVPDQTRLLKLKQDLQTIRRAVLAFSITKNRYPEDLAELERDGILNRLPKDPFGGEWEYDPATGEVTSTTHPDL